MARSKQVNRGSLASSAALASAVLFCVPAAATPGSILGPDGMGKIKLGMSQQDAEATGDLVQVRTSGSCTMFALKSAPKDEIFLIQKKDGVVTIRVPDQDKDTMTPEQIRMGSAKDDV